MAARPRRLERGRVRGHGDHEMAGLAPRGGRRARDGQVVRHADPFRVGADLSLRSLEQRYVSRMEENIEMKVSKIAALRAKIMKLEQGNQ